MTIAIYKIDNGRLVSTTDSLSNVASQDILDAKGYAVKDIPSTDIHNPPLHQRYIWNESTLVWDLEDNLKGLQKQFTFWQAFTQAEVESMLGDTNANVALGIRVIELRGFADLDDPKTDSWFDLLVTRGHLVDAARKDSIIEQVRDY
jgi:hypothetical protein